jgi:PKD repeat protein
VDSQKGRSCACDNWGMKKTIGVFVAAALALPGFASAQSAADLQAQVQQLLQQVSQLTAQVNAQQGGGTGTSLNTNATGAIAAPGATSGSSVCPGVGRILKRGSTGDDVLRLQQYLARDPSVYPEGTVSGYYGALTEKAVQRWQAKYNIIANGTPATTGYGQVGPRTAAAMALQCSSGGGASPVGGYIQVSPISGNAPLNVNVVATVNSTNSCNGAIYLLNWGDGSNPISIPVSAGNCQQVSQSYQHTYTSGGTFQITLSAGAHQTGATVTVSGNATTNTGTNTGGTNTNAGGVPAETFTAAPTSGAAPLNVSFTGTLNTTGAGWCSTGCSNILVFGDGSQAAVPLPTTQGSYQTYAVAHTYQSNGTYTATLYQGQAGSGRPTVGTPITITVGAGGTNTGTNTGTFNPPAVSPGAGGNPFAVSLTFDYSLATCNYGITWGDSKIDSSSGGCSGTGIASKTITHTYATGGTYTITLGRDGQTSTAGVTIAQ